FEEVDFLGLSGRRGHARDVRARPAEQSIDETGLADVRSTGERDLREGARRWSTRVRDRADEVYGLDDHRGSSPRMGGATDVTPPSSALRRGAPTAAGSARSRIRP